MAVGLVSPWINFYREVEALFVKDPNVQVQMDEDAMELRLYVEGIEKAEAIARILPSEKVYGNVTLKVSVVPSNSTERTFLEVFEKAFEGNDAFSRVVSTSLSPKSIGADYVLFKREVVQYYNDDLSDANRHKSTLYQDIAKDVFVYPEGVYFCTELE